MNQRIRQIIKAEKMLAEYYAYLEWLNAVNGGNRYWRADNERP